MNRIAIALLICVLLHPATGCVPRVRVKRNPDANDCGFRYYRPKPYLLLTPAGNEIVEKDKTTKMPSDEFVSIQLQYLPDFSEEYAIDVRNGLGTSKVELTLEDGWNLTGVNQELDAQFDENVEALANLVKAGGSLIPTGPEIADRGRRDPDGTQYKWVVRATNVPLGYYESVIGCSAGRKSLFGWRYVGFAPFNHCPVQLCGSAKAHCGDPEAAIYGLAFQDGVMVFRQLNDLQMLPVEQPDHYQKTMSQTGNVTRITGGPGEGADATALDDERIVMLEDVLRELTGDPLLVVAPRVDGGVAVQLARPASLDTERAIYRVILEETGLTDDLVNIIPPLPERDDR